MDYIACGRYFRNLVVGVETKVPLKNGRMVTAVNFDNAATTPPFYSVIQEIVNFAPWYSSVHRGAGYKSKLSSSIFEESRIGILDFVNADTDSHTAIFVKNTTEALNKLSYRVCKGSKDCVVLSTSMEHHSNDLPWRDKFKVDYIDIDTAGKLSMEDLEFKLNKYRGKVRLVTVTGASNVTGYKNEIYNIAALTHKHNAQICVDGAQLVPHVPVNMRPAKEEEHIDYLAFSAHKMYAPFGIGVLIGPKNVFEIGDPDYSGGGTVKVVTPETVTWDDPPHKEEAGSQNIIGVAALSASIKTLNMIGIQCIEEYEGALTQYAISKLQKIPGVILYGNKLNSEGRVGIIPFNIEGVDHDLVAEILSEEAGISVRNGCFCAQPYVQKLLNINKNQLQKYVNNPDYHMHGIVRLSFGLYNNFNEIDTFLQILTRITENKNYYIRKYYKFV